MAMRFYLAGDALQPEDAKLRRVEDIVRRVEGAAGRACRVRVEPRSAQRRRRRRHGRRRRAARAGERTRRHLPHRRHAALQSRRSACTTTRGRDFTEAEGWSRSPVAVINQTMAKRFWPGADPIGGRFRLADSTKIEWFTGHRRDARRQRVRHRSVRTSSRRPLRTCPTPISSRSIPASRFGSRGSRRRSRRPCARRFAPPIRTCRCSRRARSPKRGG